MGLTSAPPPPSPALESAFEQVIHVYKSLRIAAWKITLVLEGLGYFPRFSFLLGLFTLSPVSFESHHF